MAKLSLVNITATPVRAVDSSFSELVPKANIGPVPILPANVSLEVDAIHPPDVHNVATWVTMDSFDDGLKKAVIDFIDTTKEGVTAPHTIRGRQKIMTFNFFGTGTKSVAPGEIGEFQVVFSYPPGATSTTSSVSTSTINSSTVSTA
jgi:hypothetical protein